MNQQNTTATSYPTGFEYRQERIDPQRRLARLTAITDGANRALEGAARQDIGILSFATARTVDDRTYSGQLRSEPLEDFGGFEFRFALPAYDNDSDDTIAVIADIVASVEKFRKVRDELASYAETVLASAGALFEASHSHHSPPRRAGLGIAFHPRNSDFDLVVDVEMLGDDLQSGIDRVHASEVHLVEKQLSELLAKHARRATLLDRARASRGIGWIDALALKVLDASGLDRREALNRLSEQRSLEFSWEEVGTDEEKTHHDGSLYWEEGVVRGNVSTSGTDSEFVFDTLKTTGHTLPATVLAALPGRRFGDVFDHPFIPADAIITNADTPGQWLFLKLVMPELVLDEELGGASEIKRVT